MACVYVCTICTHDCTITHEHTAFLHEVAHVPLHSGVLESALVVLPACVRLSKTSS